MGNFINYTISGSLNSYQCIVSAISGNTQAIIIIHTICMALHAIHLFNYPNSMEAFVHPNDLYQLTGIYYLRFTYSMIDIGTCPVPPVDGLIVQQHI